MKNIKKWMATAGVGLAVMMLTAVALPGASADTVSAPAWQATAPGSGSTQTDQATTPEFRTAPAQRGDRVGGASDEYLAQALGVSADELEAAKQTAYQAALDQALAQGLITQEQADAIAERSSAAGRLSSRYLRGFTGSDGSSIDMDALLAEALGVTTDELAAARVEAQELALAAAVEAGSITQEQADQMKAEQALKTYLDEQGLQDQVRSLYENLVNQAVQAGVITQEQADSILSSQRSFGGMRGFDGFHGRGGMRMPGMRGSQAPDSSSSSPSRYFQPPAVTGSDL
jgi:transcriptional regulator with XRE-family HTH domain